jgi:hypothetical protein
MAPCGNGGEMKRYLWLTWLFVVFADHAALAQPATVLASSPRVDAGRGR